MLFSKLFKKRQYSFQSVVHGLLVTIGTLIGVAGIRRGWVYDEMECLRSGWFIAQSMIPYVDFFQHHHPLFYYILSPFAFLLSPTGYLFTGRLLSLVFCFLMLLYTYRLAALFCTRFGAKISVLIVCAWNMFADSAFEVRPDIPQVAIATLGTYYFFCFLENKKYKYGIMSACAYSCSFLFLQKSFIFLVFAILVLFYEWWKSNISLFKCVLWILVCGLPILFYWVLLYIQGHFYDYWVCNYLFNAVISQKFTFLNLLKTMVNKVFLPNVVLWFFVFIGFFYHKKSYLILLVYIIVISLIGMRIDGMHYWIILLPYISIFASLGLKQIFKQQERLLLFFIFFLLCPSIKIWSGNIAFGNHDQIKLLAYFRSLSNDQDTCFGDGLTCNFRKSPDFFWHGDFWGNKNIYNMFLPYHSLDSKEILLRFPAVVQKTKLCGSDDIDIVLNNYYKIIDKKNKLFILKKER
ncbi:MAG: hypothetical protein ACJAZS_000163 [Alteromonas naphthalenivorans]|jgi:hypothetical protein